MVADYEKMYLRMAHQVEEAVRILTAVQQVCEDIYVESGDAKITVLPMDDEDETQTKNPERDEE